MALAGWLSWFKQHPVRQRLPVRAQGRQLIGVSLSHQCTSLSLESIKTYPPVKIRKKPLSIKPLLSNFENHYHRTDHEQHYPGPYENNNKITQKQKLGRGRWAPSSSFLKKYSIILKLKHSSKKIKQQLKPLHGFHNCFFNLRGIVKKNVTDGKKQILTVIVNFLYQCDVWGMPKWLVKHYFWACLWECFWKWLVFELVICV